MKTVYYEKCGNTGFQWKSNNPSCQCVMAVYAGKEVGFLDLQVYKNDNVITNEEYSAIRAFDGRYGRLNHLKVLRKLARRLGMRLRKV